MDEYAMLDNIRAHSLMVARVASFLHQSLSDSPEINGTLASKKLIVAGALLHDIAKTPCLESHCDHAKQGRDICLKHGYTEVAEVVREHVILTEFSHTRYKNGIFLAKEIVYYADKRVRHDEIVSLEERLEYILKHYGNNDAERYRLIRDNFSKCQRLEKCLFAFLPITADGIQELISTVHISTANEISPLL